MGLVYYFAGAPHFDVNGLFVKTLKVEISLRHFFFTIIKMQSVVKDVNADFVKASNIESIRKSSIPVLNVSTAMPPQSPALKGNMAYDIISNQIWFANGTTWAQVGGPPPPPPPTLVTEQPPPIVFAYFSAPPFSSPGLDMTDAPNVDIFLLKGDAAINTLGGDVIANVSGFNFGFFCAVNAGGIGIPQQIIVNNLWTPSFSAPVITTVPQTVDVPVFGIVPNQLPILLVDNNGNVKKATVSPNPTQDGIIITFTVSLAGDWAMSSALPMGITFA